MKTFFLLLVMLILSINLHANPPDSCLWAPGNPIGPVFSDESSHNLTPTIKIDTCGLYVINPDFYWHFSNGADTSDSYYLGFPSIFYYKEYFALKRFYTRSVWGVKIPWSVFDTTGKDLNAMYYFTIDDINTNRQEIFDAFQQVKQIYGNIKFRFNFDKNISIHDAWSNHSNGDYEYKWGEYSYIESDNFVNSAEFAEFISNIAPDVECKYRTEFYLPLTVKESETQNQFLIYPNPVSDFLMINGLDASQVQSISIFNTFGQKLYEGDLKEKIDVSFLTPGVYFIKIGSKLEKFMKM